MIDTTAQPVKFTFERRFGDRRKNPFAYGEEEPTIGMAAHKAALEEARAAAHAEGLEAARAEETARLARAVEALNEHLSVLAFDLRKIEEAATGEAIRFAQAFAAKLAGELVKRYPSDRIEEAARSVMLDVRGMPHLALRVAPELVEEAKARIDRLAHDHGFDGRLVVLGDPNAAPGDATIEWADGGVIVERAAVEARIEAVVAALCHPTSPDTDPS